MDITNINQVIRAMCVEVKEQEKSTLNWQLLTEEDLLYEVVISIFSSQMVFELAIATVDKLRELGRLQLPQPGLNFEEYKLSIITVLSEPIPIVGNNGITRFVKPRFKNRLATFLTTNIIEIYGRGYSVKQILFSANSVKKAREALIRHVQGFGPKQSSLFLRRVGYCTDLAVLDIHVLDYLRLAKGLTLQANKLSCLSFYEHIENKFREVADSFGYSVGCVDLATWLTMRVAKRGNYLWA